MNHDIGLSSSTGFRKGSDQEGAQVVGPSSGWEGPTSRVTETSGNV